MTNQRAWLCNGEKPNCLKTSCALLFPRGDCSHTLDERYARSGGSLYFVQKAGGYLWQEEYEEDEDE